ncbi:hypothetical protein V3C99_003771 [Haemonchus contortus]
MSWIPSAISFISITTSTFGVASNSLLIYLILTKTPQQLSSYSVLILNWSIGYLFVCIAALFERQRIMISGASSFFIFSGPCTFLGSKACFVGSIFLLHCLVHGFWSMLYSFAYRYYILGHSQPKKGILILISVILYLPSLAYFILYCSKNSDETKLKAEIKIQLGIDASAECVSGYLNEFELHYALIYITIIPFVIYIAILILRKLTIRKLKSYETAMSEGTRQLHTQMLKMLTIQACLPTTVVVAVIGSTLGRLNIAHNLLLENSLNILIVPAQAANSLVSLYFVKPYRIWICNFFVRLTKSLPMQRVEVMTVAPTSGIITAVHT